MRLARYILGCLLIGTILLIFQHQAFAAFTSLTNSHINVQLNHPSAVIRGSEFTISSLFQNKLEGTDLKNITLAYSTQNEIFQIVDNATISFDNLAGDGSFGKTTRFRVPTDVANGEYFLNTKLVYYYEGSFDVYEYVIQKSLTLTVQDKAQIRLIVNSPQAIFPGEIFQIKTELTNLGLSARNVTLTIIPPQNLEFRGQTNHNIGDLDQDETVSVISEILAPETINQDYRAPFQVRVSYSDESGQKAEEFRNETILVRQRSFLEVGSPNGFWIGSLYVPYSVGIGTLIGIPSTIFGVLKWLRRRSRQQAKK